MVLLITILLALCGGSSVSEDKVLTMFWNVENFFDWKDQGTGESDSAFSSEGSRHWTSSRFYSKCSAVAKVIFHIADEYERLPDVVGFAEIENKGVLSKLLSSTLLRKCGYVPVHFDSGDRRGIDVAFLYRECVFELVASSLKTPEENGVRMATRDMLHIALRHRTLGKELDFVVCHHPSKFGGEKVSGPRRYAAMVSLRELCDSLKGTDMIVMGDFNDGPDSPQMDILSDMMVNKADSLFFEGKGTIRYGGRWELIDMFLVSAHLDKSCRMNIIEAPFLLKKESAHPGMKPFRTYVGPKYSGGVSDHLPIVLELDLH